ncbi:anaerobic ribonucleoside-triphosphate reductase activating protein [Merdibacter massiliensis]|uniref:anaerobic ribonucleoside-triphosphate reductase activating protein n=1 Tax=Merdibacter massiliensis TaxID=1871030 RepID=UPI00096AA0E9|nr:anaerobic ribonucleoside-triphosphate reductase activating protein [Merdibacter massiliensis]
MPKQMIRLASPLQLDSFVDGPGVRMVLWTQGCPHHCEGCHNPQTHDPQQGTLFAVDDLIEQIVHEPLQTGLTFSGGEPFWQSDKLIPIAKAAKEKGLSLWAYSGYTFEQLMADNEKKRLLELLDVLVDGRFVMEQKDYRLKFKGSRNQRIIDVPASFKEGKVILSAYDADNQKLQ